MITAVQFLSEMGLVLVVACMLGCLYRVVRGPTLADRALAVDTMSVLLIAVVLLLSMRTGTKMYMDGALVLSLLSFTGTIALAQFIVRRGKRGGSE
jgi:multicomponent Na+:H+ antiporter subunit F